MFELLRHIQGSLGKDSFETVIVIIWGIWSNRNRILVGKSLVTEDLLDWAETYIHTYRAAHHSGQLGTSDNVLRDLVRWIPPIKGRVKQNTYASFFPNTSMGGAGMVIRNNRDEVLLTETIPLRCCLSSDMA